jgi:hypothetical protein
MPSYCSISRRVLRSGGHFVSTYLGLIDGSSDAFVTSRVLFSQRLVLSCEGVALSGEEKKVILCLCVLSCVGMTFSGKRRGEGEKLFFVYMFWLCYCSSKIGGE